MIHEALAERYVMNPDTIEHAPRGQVIRLETPFRQRNTSARQAALMQRFAVARRSVDDVFWMKENAELLGVFEATGAQITSQALEVYAPFYEDLDHRVGFFPQYYRFFLSLALDIEALGMAGESAERLVHWVARSGLIDAELSDLQRAEARRLCVRRGVDPVVDASLDDRLRSFIAREATFALPNKKAAYELTHIVFYLSEYGRRDPQLGKAACQSLRHAGTLAFLELNVDLLSEICIALRFAGETPPRIWERWLRDQVRRFAVEPIEGPVGHSIPQDDYHPWLMLNWFMDVSGQGGFGQEMPEGSVIFAAPKPCAGPLRELSDSIYKLGDQRSGEWAAMREGVGEALSDEARNVLLAAEEAVDFDRFFRGFARATGPAQMSGLARREGAL
ncbi:MAG: hypothetical protein AAFY35_05775 [Pseudomonadota bacterium]